MLFIFIIFFAIISLIIFIINKNKNKPGENTLNKLEENTLNKPGENTLNNLEENNKTYIIPENIKLEKLLDLENHINYM